jgi:hypothetical protein
MTEYTHKRKPTPSRLLAGFGAVKPVHKPEDYRLVRAEMEEAMAEEVGKEIPAQKHGKKAALLHKPQAH